MTIWWIICIASVVLTGINNIFDIIDKKWFNRFSCPICWFAFAKTFWSLSLGWGWIFISPVWFILAFYIPGGFTITNLICNSNGIMNVPTWGLIVGIVIDVISFAAISLKILSRIFGNRN